MSNVERWAHDDGLMVEVWRAGREEVMTIQWLFPTCVGVTRVQVHGASVIKVCDANEDRLSTAPAPDSGHLREGVLKAWIETWLLVERPNKPMLVIHGLVANFTTGVNEEIVHYEVPGDSLRDLSTLRRDRYTALRRRMWSDLLSPTELLRSTWLKEPERVAPFNLHYTTALSRQDAPRVISEFATVLRLIHPLTVRSGELPEGDVCVLVEVIPSWPTPAFREPHSSVRLRIALTAQWCGGEYVVVHELETRLRVAEDAPLDTVLEAMYAEFADDGLETSCLPGNAWVVDAKRGVNYALHYAQTGIDLVGGMHYGQALHSTLGHLPWGWLFFAAHQPPAAGAMPQLPGEEE